MNVPPTPGVGIGTSGGAPLILASDGSSDVIGYSFTNGRLKEAFRLRQEGFVTQTPPVVLSDGRAAIGLQGAPEGPRKDPAFLGRLLLMTPDRTGFVDQIQSSFAAPTRLPDGRIAVVGNFGKVTIVSGAQVATTLQAPGRSIASAAASRTHLFVSAEDGFVTYDAATLAEVSRVDWVGGGLNPPAIGPKGHVYAIASNILFVFPPPIKKPFTVTNSAEGRPAGRDRSRAGDGAAAAELQAADDRERQPPVRVRRAGRRRLRQGRLPDHRDRLLQEARLHRRRPDQGRQRKGESRDARRPLCSKNKCKVFEQIICANS